MASALAVLLLVASSALAEPVHHGVAAGMLKVNQVSDVETNNNAEVIQTLSINNFQLISYNRGDYSFRVGVGTESVEDAQRGVVMTSVTENGRDNFGSNGYPISAFETNASGAHRIVTFLATEGGAGNAIEYNVNVAAAWFPYDRYLGGFARNSAGVNGGTNDLFTGSPGLVLGTHFRGVAAGRSVVDLRSHGIDSRTSGVLLVSGAKDENNFALSQVNTNDGTWNVFVRDNAQTAYSSYEQDPVAFVFIPRTNTALISGRFRGDGSIDLFSGASPQFTVTNLGPGRWDLRIPGRSPTNGVLILSPEGGGAWNGDNILSYQITGDGWEIQSRDTPGNGLQTPDNEPVASFVFIPAPSPGFTVTPTNNLVTAAYGGTATFSVVLHSRPATNVTVAVSSSQPGRGIPSPSTLTFRPHEWNVPHTVTVTGQNNPSTEVLPYMLVLSPAVSADPAYHGLDPANVTALLVPARAHLISPTNNTPNAGVSTALQVLVTNHVPGNLTARFYGREVFVPYPAPDFSIVLLPDTQNYAAEKYGGTKEMFIAQTEWIITNRVARNIAYVSNLGDIVNDGDIYQGQPNLTQWRNATNAMYRLENPNRTQLPDGIPYGVAVGNHDQEPNGDPNGTTLYYNTYFGVSRFAGRSYYGGHYGTNNNNHFDFFSASGLDFIVLYFEYDTNANPAVLAWGSEVLRTNAHRRAIVVTHYLGGAQTPTTLSAQASAIYHALKGHTNLFLMLGGHVSGEGWRKDTFAGNTVHSLISDYQFYDNGGQGLLRIMTFSPSNNLVRVETYSPWLRQYEADEDSEFSFPYNLQADGRIPPDTNFVVLGTEAGLQPGSVSSCVWPGLKAGKSYEWFVTVTDGSGQTATSPVWRFRTGQSNNPPTVVNLSRTIFGDAPTNLTLTASDPNGDALTFQIRAPTTQGLLRDFVPEAGTVTYHPAHGFRGTDRFTFAATDGQATSSIATLNLAIIAPPDDNTNGLPDAWEAAYGITDPAGDEDQDGQSNYEEYRANTNPTNAASAFRILSLERLTNGWVNLAWASAGGTRYRIQVSNSDTNGNFTGSFKDVTRPLTNEMDPAPPGVASTQVFTDTYTDTAAPTNPARYYRIRIAP
ncbi:MAG TPA: Ig-like domain-containing protein [Candidatus Paceibacterota bacterium]|nr:Ig-like domain-containing protein [Candidatus Paceibacterota bacterium]